MRRINYLVLLDVWEEHQLYIRRHQPIDVTKMEHELTIQLESSWLDVLSKCPAEKESLPWRKPFPDF